MAINKIRKTWQSIFFKNSQRYWEDRYQNGGNSGEGSYNKLAKFKADTITEFIKQNDVKDAIEFGCGDGNVLSFTTYHSYIGLDVSRTAITQCINKFNNDKSKSFFLYDSLCFQDNNKMFSADLTLSIDVIFHLVEDKIYSKYMSDLFLASNKYVIIYSSDFEGEQIRHMRQRKFTKWVEANVSDFKLINYIKNKYPYNPLDPDTSLSNFYFYQKEYS
jgi:cyclopropane fatty-acyl-phospholipid synthase-like methyltransferase